MGLRYNSYMLSRAGGGGEGRGEILRYISHMEMRRFSLSLKFCDLDTFPEFEILWLLCLVKDFGRVMIQASHFHIKKLYQFHLHEFGTFTLQK